MLRTMGTAMEAQRVSMEAQAEGKARALGFHNLIELLLGRG